MNRIGLLSLGCARNLVDSEEILARLRDKGYQLTEDIKDARIAIVNTCCFIEEAKKESIEAILDLIDLKRRGYLKKILVYGCLSERYGSRLIKDLKEIDAFIGTSGLKAAGKSFYLTPAHYAYIKICEGCQNNCSFCIIPKIKPRFCSRPIESILEEVSSLDRGAALKELNIIGQDITLYGSDLYKKNMLTVLLKRILQTTRNIDWIRLLYLHPAHISDDLLNLVSAQERLCKYIDLPIQHINDRLLTLMTRTTCKYKILKLIEKIRKKIKGVALRTTLMVGFPTETDKEFAELLKFIEDVRFERLGVFNYSREEKTPAFNLKGQVPAAVKKERFEQIMSRQQEVSRQVNAAFMGKTMDILVDEENETGYLGRSQYDAPEVDGLVYLRSRRKLNKGELVKAKITDTLEYDLVAEAI
jgi:ribosomal protein S12 methylthiotransferase